MQAAILVGLAMAVLWFLEKLGGTPMVIRPIVVSPVIGALLGDLQTGVMVGATLELVFMGAIQIGAAVPPDVLVGAGLGTAFAIQSGQGADIALALALPIAILAQSLKVHYPKLVHGSRHEVSGGRRHQKAVRIKHRRSSASVFHVFRSRFCGSALRFTGG